MAFPATVGKSWRQLRPIQFIAALGDPNASSGADATSQWGLWRVDPGPRGVRLSGIPALPKSGPQGFQTKAGWRLDTQDFWIEEHGLAMEAPVPLPAGRYMVTGDREKTVPLNVAPNGAWSLEGGAKLYDVTHLPCRSARYVAKEANASPLSGADRAFPVKPGGKMPPLQGYEHKDYAVVFVVAEEV